MSIVTAQGPLRDTLSVLFEAPAVSSVTTATKYSFTNAEGDVLTVNGTGFTYNANHEPVTGTITSIEAFAPGNLVTPALSVTNLSGNTSMALFWGSGSGTVGFKAALDALILAVDINGTTGDDHVETYGPGSLFQMVQGNDVIDIWHGGASNDPTTVLGGDGQDIFNVHGEAFPFFGNNFATLDGGAQNDLFNLFGSTANSVRITGGAGFDSLFINNGGINPLSMTGVEQLEFGDLSIVAKYVLFNDTDLAHNGLKIALNVKGSAHDTGGNQVFIERVAGNAAILDLSAVTVSNFTRTNQAFEYTLAFGGETVARNDVVIGVLNARNIFNFNLGADAATGGNRDDAFWGGAGNDLFRGGLGVDEARYNLARATYQITFLGENRYSVRDLRPLATAGHEGTDTIIDTEKVLFGFGGAQSGWFSEFLPRISSSLGAAVANVNVAENGTFAVDVNATDGNTALAGPQHQNLTYQLAGGTDAAKFLINPTTGLVTFKAAADFEAPADANHDNVYTVLIRAFDGMTYDQQTINIRVTNVLGVTIIGTAGPNIINQTTAPAGQPKPTAEADIINAGDGADDITALGGTDRITPGAGADVIRYLTPAEGGDIITGWDATDRLFFKKAAFGNISAITATNFVTNTTGEATTPQHRFIYDSDDRTLFFDANGTGAGGRVPIATFGTDPGLTGADMLFF